MPQRMTAQQFRRFEAPARAAWITGTAKQLCSTYAAYFHALRIDAEQIGPLCQSVEQWAEIYGIAGERDIAQLCCVAVTLGHEFWRDPRFSDVVAGTIGNAELTRTDATQLLVRKTGEWLTGLWRNDTLAGSAERLTYYLRTNAGPTPQILRIILPGHWAVLDAPSNARLMDWIIAALPAMPMPAQRLAGMSFSLVHGTGWMCDPQYGRLLQMVVTARNPEDLARAVSDFYSEIA